MNTWVSCSLELWSFTHNAYLPPPSYLRTVGWPNGALGKTLVTWYSFSAWREDDLKFGHVQIPRWPLCGCHSCFLPTCEPHNALMATENKLCSLVIAFWWPAAPSNNVGIHLGFTWLTGGCLMETTCAKWQGLSKPIIDRFLPAVLVWWLASGHINISIRLGALITMALPAPPNTSLCVTPVHCHTTVGQWLHIKTYLCMWICENLVIFWPVVVEIWFIKDYAFINRKRMI